MKQGSAHIRGWLIVIVSNDDLVSMNLTIWQFEREGQAKDSTIAGKVSDGFKAETCSRCLLDGSRRQGQGCLVENGT